MKTFFWYLLLGLSLLSGCQSETPKVDETEHGKGIDMKKYYYPTAFDGKTRYYLYREEIKNGKEAMLFYSSCRVERVGEKQLVFVKYHHYHDTAVAIDSSIIRVEKDGLYCDESYFFKSDWIHYVEIGEKKFLPWTWSPNEKYGMKRSISESLATKYEVDSFSEHIVLENVGTGKLDKAFDSKKEYTLLKGTSERISNGTSETYASEYWDLEGVGLYRVEMKTEGFELQSILVDLLTKEQYEGLFE